MSETLNFRIDRWNGVIIDMSKQSLKNQVFVDKLKESIAQWTTEGKRGLWVTAKTEHSALIPSLIELGFDFHHAQPGYLCLTKWLPVDIPSHIPGYASHYVGVAGFVVNSNNELLVIREKYQGLKNNTIAVWKLPGGLADAGEEIGATAVREVKEETGVESEYICIIAFRHMHNFRHGCSDLYYACLMKPLSSEINACPQEIEECKWMDIEEYSQLNDISEVNKFFVQRYKEIISTNTGITLSKVLSFDKQATHSVYGIGKV
ncbi:nudix hydrolase 8-like isoform X1 [Biomphalaria pfeifferi]|uniref:Nucleoside diphosphate-linked moiety X motif 6 n=1 Tax=Biomphalaria pfeifferi TaxID=112525 RepID=A0AAD8F8B0_BIOPF|nr:nudix hydrolase 8-like isoform X1 [Biomphalaria pfeifferi]